MITGPVGHQSDKEIEVTKMLIEDSENHLIVYALIPMHQHVPEGGHSLKGEQVIFRYDVMFPKDREKVAKARRLTPSIKRHEVVRNV